MTQTPLLKMGSSIKIDGNLVAVVSIHSDYVIAVDKKKASKVFSFEKVEASL